MISSTFLPSASSHSLPAFPPSQQSQNQPPNHQLATLEKGKSELMRGIVIAVSEILHLSEGPAIFVQLLLEDNVEHSGEQVCQIMLTHGAFEKVGQVGQDRGSESGLQEDDLLLMYAPLVKSFLWKGQEAGGSGSSKAASARWYLVREAEGVDVQPADGNRDAVLLYSVPTQLDAASLSNCIQLSTTAMASNKECVVQGKVQAISHLGFLDIAANNVLIAGKTQVVLVRVYMTHMKCATRNPAAGSTGDRGGLRDSWKQVHVGAEVELRRVLFLRGQHSSGKKSFLQTGSVVHCAFTIRSSIIVKAASSVTPNNSNSAASTWTNPSPTVTLLPREVSCRSVYYHVWHCFVFSRLAQLTLSPGSSNMKFSKTHVDRMINNIEDFFHLQTNALFRVNRAVQSEFADPWYCDFHIARVQQDADYILTLLPHFHHVLLLHKMVKKHLQTVQSQCDGASKRMTRFDYHAYQLTVTDLLPSYVGKHLFVGKLQLDCISEGRYVATLVGEDLTELAASHHGARIQLQVVTARKASQNQDQVTIDQNYWRKVMQGVLSSAASSSRSNGCFLVVLQQPDCLVEQRPAILTEGQAGDGNFALTVLVQASDMLLVPLKVEQLDESLSTSFSIATTTAAPSTVARAAVSVREVLNSSRNFLQGMLALEGIVVRKVLLVDSFKADQQNNAAFASKRQRITPSGDKLLEEKKISVTIRDVHHADTIILYIPAHLADFLRYFPLSSVADSVTTCSSALQIGAVVRFEGLQACISEAKKKLYLRLGNSSLLTYTSMAVLGADAFQHMLQPKRARSMVNRMQQLVRSIDFNAPGLRPLPRMKLIDINRHALTIPAMYQHRSMFQVVANVVFIRRVTASLRCPLCQGTSYRVQSLPCCIACSMSDTSFLQCMSVFWEVVVAIDDGTCEANVIFEGDEALVLLSGGHSPELDSKVSNSLHFNAWQQIAESIRKLVLRGNQGYHRFVYDPIEAQKGKGQLVQYRKTNVPNVYEQAQPNSEQGSSSSNSNANSTNMSSNGWAILELDLEYDDSLLMQLLEDYEESALTEFQSLTACAHVAEEAILKEIAAGKLATNPSRALQLYLRSFPYSLQMKMNVGINLYAANSSNNNVTRQNNAANPFQAATSIRHLRLQECNFYSYAYMAQFYPMTTNQYKKLELQCFHIAQILSICKQPTARKYNATQPQAVAINPVRQDHLLEEGYLLLDQLKQMRR